MTKIAGGGDEITVQGDLSDDIFEFVTEKYEVPEDNCEQVEEKKKKNAAGETVRE